MTKGATAIPKPNKETAIPAAFLRLATKSNPNIISKAPRATVPKAIGFIISQPSTVSEWVNGILDILRIRENVDFKSITITKRL